MVASPQPVRDRKDLWTSTVERIRFSRVYRIPAPYIQSFYCSSASKEAVLQKRLLQSMYILLQVSDTNPTCERDDPAHQMYHSP